MIKLITANYKISDGRRHTIHWRKPFVAALLQFTAITALAQVPELPLPAARLQQLNFMPVIPSMMAPPSPPTRPLPSWRRFASKRTM
uniref:Uncharacterized protein n=1 Tax=uncultured marine microorganism HF4000_009G21 TaxID=455515 RepID=B3T1B9_9ZZZZ|nr:hypothetical protein ALOHA_HF4000009G21ctg1g14 [uncultured marine microorganism HF4000_009G21]